MNNKTPITEEMHLEKEWFELARKQTFEALPSFVNHVMNDYMHDYGTICHAVAACALAAAWAADDSPNGGITGFQANFVMWDFVKQWGFRNNKTGLKLIDYDEMLYPQYKERFEKVLSVSVWESLQERAKECLNEESSFAAEEVKKHWENIVSGNVPFGYKVKDKYKYKGEEE